MQPIDGGAEVDFLSWLPLTVLSDAGGWIVLISGVLLMGRMFQTGKLVTKDQHLRLVKQIEEDADEQRAALEKHFLDLTEASRLSWQSAYETMKSAYEARLEERAELVAEARLNIKTMLEIQRDTAGSVQEMARAAKITERLLVAMDDAFGFTPKKGAK